MLCLDLRSITTGAHVDASRAVTLWNILVPPMAGPFAAHVDTARRASVRRWMGQLWPLGIEYTKYIARLFVNALFVVFHVSLPLFSDCALEKRQSPYRHFRDFPVCESDKRARLHKARLMHLRPS